MKRLRDAKPFTDYKELSVDWFKSKYKIMCIGSNEPLFEYGLALRDNVTLDSLQELNTQVKTHQRREGVKVFWYASQKKDDRAMPPFFREIPAETRGLAKRLNQSIPDSFYIKTAQTFLQGMRYHIHQCLRAQDSRGYIPGGPWDYEDLSVAEHGKIEVACQRNHYFNAAIVGLQKVSSMTLIQDELLELAKQAQELREGFFQGDFYKGDLVAVVAGIVDKPLMIAGIFDKELKDIARQAHESNPTRPESRVFARKDQQVEIYHLRRTAKFLDLLSDFIVNQLQSNQ